MTNFYAIMKLPSFLVPSSTSREVCSSKGPPQIQGPSSLPAISISLPSPSHYLERGYSIVAAMILQKVYERTQDKAVCAQKLVNSPPSIHLV